MIKREKMLINPRFQLRLTLSFLIISLISIVTFYSAITFFFLKMISFGEMSGLPTNNIYFTFIQNQRELMNIIFLVTTFIYLILFVVAGISISHKIAGPLHKLNKVLKKSTEENTIQSLEEIKFRNKDYFPEIEENYNLFIRSLKSKNTNS